MGLEDIFEQNKEKAFESYDEYMKYLFACVNIRMMDYIESLKEVFATGQGDFKNVLYPDIEIAYETCEREVINFSGVYQQSDLQNKRIGYIDTDVSAETGGSSGEQEASDAREPEDYEDIDLLPDEDDDSDYMDDELADLLGSFALEGSGTAGESRSHGLKPYKADITQMLQYIAARAGNTDQEKVKLPFYQLCRKMNCTDFTQFCFVCAILSSTQTSYASTFQVINQNASLSAPTIESAARLYYGRTFSITGAYGEMSLCLEQLGQVLDLNVYQAMPFSTVVTTDKRIIDYLFGMSPERLDVNYSRFFKLLTPPDELKEPEPVMANHKELDAIDISYGDGCRIFSLYGDIGSGRKFFVREFGAMRLMGCIAINCRKLFEYDLSFITKALWAVSRECFLANACCCLDELAWHEEEKDKFMGYLDLALNRFQERGLLVFLVSQDQIPMSDVTHSDFSQIELPTPSNQEREDIWRYYAGRYQMAPEVDLEEMATKFLFTPGKIKAALHLSRSLSSMDKEILIGRDCLFRACYAQMSSELTKKATKVEAKFSFDDIVMNKDQKETLQHAIDQMTYRKKVYDNWNYTRKYPYGRGLSVLLFGAPGTGKSMCAQVIAHELKLELYRVDLSKVIDKYVGETEKSISMIFREAKKCNVVLFFDECDTLFAKRTDDGGSNQSSNNNKTAMLLQEVEAYDGVSVLATNYKHNIDPAFFRRMKYIVEFQFPDPDTRFMLWNTTIPKSTPLAEDVDIRFLADRFEFVGGNIKNCILNAAFLAAADPEADGEVGMKHYLQAIKYEFVKTGKVFTKADFEPYSYMVGL